MLQQQQVEEAISCLLGFYLFIKAQQQQQQQLSSEAEPSDTEQVGRVNRSSASRDPPAPSHPRRPSLHHWTSVLAHQILHTCLCHTSSAAGTPTPTSEPTRKPVLLLVLLV